MPQDDDPSNPQQPSTPLAPPSSKTPETKLDTSDEVVQLIKDVATLKGQRDYSAIKEDLLEIKGSISGLGKDILGLGKDIENSKSELGKDIRNWVFGGLVTMSGIVLAINAFFP